MAKRIKAKQKFRVGDKVRVIGAPEIKFAPGVRDEIGTNRILRYMLGRVYTVRGFDRYGQLELQPTRSDVVWIEPWFLKLQKPRQKLSRA